MKNSKDIRYGFSNSQLSAVNKLKIQIFVLRTFLISSFHFSRIQRISNQMKISKAEKQVNNKLLMKKFEKCTAEMQDLSNYFLAYNKLITSVMENCNKHIEDDANTWKETLDELYGMYGCLEDEFCFLTLYDKAAPTINKRREHHTDFSGTNYEYLMFEESSKKQFYSITSNDVEIAMMKAENTQKELFEIRQSANKNNEGKAYCCCIIKINILRF